MWGGGCSGSGECDACAVVCVGCEHAEESARVMAILILGTREVCLR